MNDLDVLEGARPDVAPLTERERQLLRSRIFADASVAQFPGTDLAEPARLSSADHSVVVAAGRPARSPRRWLLWAAAVAVVACGAIVVTQRRAIAPIDEASPTDPVSSVADASIPQTTTVDGTLDAGVMGWPPLFPALDPSDPDNAIVKMVSGQIGFENPQRTTAVIGNRDGATISDLAYVSAIDSDAFATAMARVYLPPTTVTIDGSTLTVYALSVPGSSEVTAMIEHPEGPDIAVTAADPVGLIRALGVGFATATTDAEGSFGLEFSDLPPGYVTVIEPYVQIGGQSFPGMQWGDMGAEHAIGVNVYLGGPQLRVGRALRATTVHDRAAWFDAADNTVYWQVQSGVWASATTTGGLDAVLAVAARVQFVDEATWRARYPDTNQFFGSTTAATTTQPGGSQSSDPVESVASAPGSIPATTLLGGPATTVDPLVFAGTESWLPRWPAVSASNPLASTSGYGMELCDGGYGTKIMRVDSPTDSPHAYSGTLCVFIELTRSRADAVVSCSTSTPPYNYAQCARRTDRTDASGGGTATSETATAAQQDAMRPFPSATAFEQPEVFHVEVSAPLGARTSFSNGVVSVRREPAPEPVNEQVAHPDVCIEIELESGTASGCASPRLLATGLAYGAFRDGDGPIEIIGIVPDEVTEIDINGTTVTPISNVWHFTLDEGGATPRITVRSADGREASTV